MCGGSGIIPGPPFHLVGAQPLTMNTRSADIEADYADRVPMSRLDRLLAGETVANWLFLLMLSGCCFVAPVAGLVAGLGLLGCRTPEARLTATFLAVAAAGHGVVFWAVALQSWLH